MLQGSMADLFHCVFRMIAPKSKEDEATGVESWAWIGRNIHLLLDDAPAIQSTRRLSLVQHRMTRLNTYEMLSNVRLARLKQAD